MLLSLHTHRSLYRHINHKHATFCLYIFTTSLWQLPSMYIQYIYILALNIPAVLFFSPRLKLTHTHLRTQPCSSRALFFWLFCLAVLSPCLRLTHTLAHTTLLLTRPQVYQGGRAVSKLRWVARVPLPLGRKKKNPSRVELVGARLKIQNFWKENWKFPLSYKN